MRVGAVYCWGAGGAGGLGNGSTTHATTATPVDMNGALAGKSIASVAVGQNSACALDTLGAAYCWGYGTYGALGNGTTTGTQTTPTPVLMPSGEVFTAITSRNFEACGLDHSGAAYCWGANASGGLGDGSTTQRNVPTPVIMSAVVGGAFSTVSAGYGATCALTPTGIPYCWGRNDYGQLGDGTTIQRQVPTPVFTAGVLAGKTLVKLASDDWHTCVLDSDGQAYCWGINYEGGLGDGTTTSSSVPVAVTMSGVLAGERLVDIDTGTYFTCALDSNGKAYCWGRDTNATPDPWAMADSSVPLPVNDSLLPAGTTFTSIHAGRDFACGQKANGRVYCWGLGAVGALGDGTSADMPVPNRPVSGLPAVPDAPTAVTASRSGSGAVVSWTPPVDTGSSAISGYTVVASPGGATCAGSSTSCVLSGLSAGATYTVSVVAVNSLGSSAAGSGAIAAGGAGGGGGGVDDGGGLANTGVRVLPYVVIALLALWLGVRLRWLGRPAPEPR